MYQQAAPWYDAIAGFDDPALTCQELNTLLSDNGCKTGLLADLGAGTATNAIEFALLGRQVLCIEQSAEMIQLGRRKIRKQIPRVQKAITWWQADITHFQLPEQTPAFTAGVCLCNTINHLLKPAEVEGFARSCFQALAPGGVLLVDSDTLDTFQVFFHHDSTLAYQDSLTRIYRLSDFDAITGRVHHITRINQKSGTLDEVLALQYHSPDFLHQVFQAAGFLIKTDHSYNPFFKRYANYNFPVKTLWILKKP